MGAAGGTGPRDVVSTGTEDCGTTWTADGPHLVPAGSVLRMACEDHGADGVDLGLAAAPGGCGVMVANTDLRAVPSGGDRLRRVSDTVSSFDAGLAPAP